MADTAQARQKADRPAAGAATGVLIDGAYAVDLGRKLPLQGGGLPAFAVQDRKRARDTLMAVQARRTMPPRARALSTLQDCGIAGLASPLAHGVAPGPDGIAGYFVVCHIPPGTPVGTATTIARAWNETELLACVLRPAATCLAEMQALGITHRAIRPDNVFQPAPGQKVTLGAAWAAPPASLQPAVFEPPYVSICLPAGRGDGSFAEDVYALGVLLVALAMGRFPLAGLDDAEIVRRKLAVGCFAALVDERAVPPIIADLARGMLAEDPEHRPSPLQLGDPEMVRARRVAARPIRLALRALEVQGQSVLSARPLAGALAAAPTLAGPLLREGHVDRWLRRSLGEAALAARLEELVRARGEATPDDGAADAMLVARVIAVLDPLAPLCWRGRAFWPDGLGAALLEAEGAALNDLLQAVAAEAIAAWGAVRPERCEPTQLRVEARQHRAILVRRGWVGGVTVLRYVLNPLMPCNSRMLGRHLVVRIADLLPALEQEAARTDRPPGGPVDAELAAFIVARQDLRLERELAILAEPKSIEAMEPGALALAQVKVLARLQERVQAPPAPTLAGSLAAALRPGFVVWQSRSRRRELEAALDERAMSGRLEGLVELLDNPSLRAQDTREAEDARHTVARIDATLGALRVQREHQIDAVRRVGQEVAAAVGVIAASASALWLAL